jgi:HNH endonuclease/NUMOD3 motif
MPTGIYVRTKAHRDKISAALKGNRFGTALKGKPKSPETRAKMSAAQKGKPKTHLFNNLHDIQQFLRNNSIWIADCGCWIWTLYCSPGGYGESSLILGEYRMHRAAYRAFKGDIPKGLYILHKCDTPPCINPDHLFPGTHQDNAADRQRKGRTAQGENHGSRTQPEKFRRSKALSNFYA